MSERGGLLARVERALEIESPALPDLALSHEDALRDHARALTARNLRVVSLALAALTVASWALDPWVFRGVPGAERIAWSRALHTALLVGGYLALRSSVIARRPMIAAFLVTGAGCAVAGRIAGLLGDLDAPWPFVAFGLFFTIAVPVVPLRVRVLYGSLFPITIIAGFTSARPGFFAHALVVPVIAFGVAVMVSGVFAGHVIYRLVDRGLTQERAQKRTAIELRSLNDTLEARVRDKTRELRLLASHLESAREGERARLARDLHDDLGQELAALRYAIAFLKQRYAREPENVRTNIEEIDALLARTAATTRRLVADLRPKILDDLGLEAAVEWLLQRAEESAGITCHVTSPASDGGEDLSLGPEVSIAAFRIVQESLTNVVRHARASRVDVTLSLEGDALHLDVRDDGIGIPETPPSKRPSMLGGGMGLVGMRERAYALGGELTIERAREGGTRVHATLPLTPSEG